MINQDKKSLRNFYKSVRASITDRDIKNSLITEFILESEQYKNADKIFAYWSVDSEVETHKIITEALKDKKEVALPKCSDKCGNMEFYYIASLSDLTDGMYGIKEPIMKHKADDFTERSLCLVPALSFDNEGYRLGYGKGYYDRFLDKFKGVSMGLCFGESLNEKLPRDSYDKKVNCIVTNEKIYDLT